MTNKLEKRVRAWIKRRAKDSYDGDGKAVLKDLFYGGCASGIVGDLVYTVDAVKFYKRYKNEINSLLSELVSDSGLSVTELFGDRWDKDDPLGTDSYNQTLLAWFGFEETAQRLAHEFGY